LIALDVASSEAGKCAEAQSALETGKYKLLGDISRLCVCPGTLPEPTKTAIETSGYVFCMDACRLCHG